MVQYTLYEYTKTVVIERKRESSGVNSTLSAPETFQISGFAKLVASSLTYPHEVCKLPIS